MYLIAVGSQLKTGGVAGGLPVQFQGKKKEARRPLITRAKIDAGAVLFQLAHLALQVILDADLVDQVELCFQEVDVLFCVVKNALEQVA